MAVDAAVAGTRSAHRVPAIDELKPKAQAAYAAAPALARKRGEQVAAASKSKTSSNGNGSSSSTQSTGERVINLPSTGDIWGAIPGEGAAMKALLVAGILLLGL